MQSVGNVFHTVRDTYRDTYQTLAWVWNSILSQYSRYYAKRALALMLFAQVLAMSITYVMREIVNALGSDDRTTALWYLFLGVGSVLLLQHIISAFHDYARELAWNYNYRSVAVRMSELFFNRTVGELIREDSDVGAEQIESAKDKVQNILYTVLFEGSSVSASVLSATILMYVVDPVAGLLMSFLITANLLWFLFWNTVIDERMTVIDRGFRKAHRRMVEKWHFVLSIKTNGVEDKVVNQIRSEINRPLYADKLVWAHWFIKVDFIRWLMNIVVALGILAYGIGYGGWTGGDTAAMFAWIFLIMEKFGFIGHLMRHLTTQVARIKAVHNALATESDFDRNHGVTYERSQ